MLGNRNNKFKITTNIRATTVMGRAETDSL